MTKSLTPFLSNSLAHVSPATPAPMIATFVRTVRLNLAFRHSSGRMPAMPKYVPLLLTMALYVLVSTSNMGYSTYRDKYDRFPLGMMVMLLGAWAAWMNDDDVLDVMSSTVMFVPTCK